MTSDIKGLFREAELHNAVLFFDECDSIFAQRSSGGSGATHQVLQRVYTLTHHYRRTNYHPADLSGELKGHGLSGHKQSFRSG